MSLIKILGGKQFTKKCLDQNITKLIWYVAKKLATTAEVPSILLVPACLVYDAFDAEIDSLVLYKQRMVLHQQYKEESENYHILERAWLKGQLTTPMSSNA